MGNWVSDTDLHELRSLLPLGTPMLVATAPVTNVMLKSVTRSLNIIDYRQLFHLSPERSNIWFGLKNRERLGRHYSGFESELY